MSRLAENFGITGNGLAKICDRLSIPYPPRGYWAKKTAGKKVVQYRLPPAEADTPPSVTISPTPPALQLEPLAPEQQERVAPVEQDGAITVPEPLLRPHQVIASWLAEHEQRRREAKRDRNSWGPSLTEWIEIDHRRHRILDALFKAAERHGCTIKTGDRRETYFSYGQERIDYKLREKQKQVRLDERCIACRPERGGYLVWWLSER